MQSNMPGQPGRPAFDVADFIFARVSVKLATGMTLAEVAREGMAFYDHNGPEPKVVRRLKDKHLQAAYRASERDRIVPWLRPDERCTHSWPIFMGRPLPSPIGAASPSERKAGRPKKVRTRRV